jgi:hypothetical protein
MSLQSLRRYLTKREPMFPRVPSIGSEPRIPRVPTLSSEPPSERVPNPKSEPREVLGFTAQRNARLAEKRKSSNV